MPEHIKVIARPNFLRVVDRPTRVKIVAGGPRGAKGDPGVDGAQGAVYEHVQSSSATLWTILHGFSHRPVVAAFDNPGRELHGDVQNPSVGVTTIEFSEPRSGTATAS